MTTVVAELQLARPGYVRPTPHGVALAVRAARPDPVGGFVRRLLGGPATPWLDLATLADVTGRADHAEAVELMRAAQEAVAIEALDEPTEAPSQSLDDLLRLISHEEKAVLANEVGSDVVASSGVDEARAGRLAALGREAVATLDRYGAPSDVSLPGWAIVDADGVSRLGAWGLHLGGRRLVLVVDGLPRLRHPAFTALVWAASRASH